MICGSGTSSRVSGWSDVDAVLGHERIGQRHLGVARAGSRTRAPSAGSRVAGRTPRRRPAAACSSSSTHSASRMKNGLSLKSVPFAGVDRHQRDAGRPGLLAGIEDTVGVAEVVVDHRLLLDGCGRGVGERRAPLVGGVPVVEEGQRGGPVVDDGRLDVLGELDGVGVGDVLLGQPFGLAGRGVALGDERGQAAGGEVGVGLAQPERSPLGSVEGLPALVAVGQLEDVGPADVGLGPAQRLGHGLRHGDHQWRDHERLAVADHGRLTRRR